ncbi:MAG TPA: PAS domain S-box protein [Spirochaetota bacterium]|nr:PAS domain S-box protein [Spirochaetota bacterium]HPF07491.1 PAS domain S-box protein [Spirochaetota bacterium]HPJ43102.1 PAS domain S-box protein [Spirochaetota bacterium]HPR38404.1 PAS domain S-box protein [Spirochaetota bacterium]HRX48444.1 PAS domain S-box protein [Spirochaetota bacterium]
MEKSSINILLVEDEPVAARLNSEHLKKNGYNVIQAYSGSEAVSEAFKNSSSLNLILMDIELGDGMDGTAAAREILNRQHIPIIFYTSHSENEIISRTEDLPSYGYILKNAGAPVLEAAIKMALNLHKTHSKTALKEEQEKEARYKDLVDNAGEAIFVAQDGSLKLVNPASREFLGRTEDELYSMPFIEFIHPEDRGLVIQNYLNRITGTYSPSQYQFRIISKDNSVKWVEINSIAYTWNGSPATLNFLTNITERKQIEDALRESENKYRKIFENIQDIFYQTDINGNIIEISPSIERYAGFSRGELLGRPVTDVYVNPVLREELIKQIHESGEVVDYELILQDKNRNTIYTSTNSHFLYDHDGNITGIEGSLRDITARKKVEIELKESLRQKELLMIELQHRVKNNLGIISSLLSLEMPKLNDEYARAVFMNARTRILSMSGIYEQLYGSGNFESVNLAKYVTDLANMILKTYSIRSRNLLLETDLDDIQLDLRRTVPLGLILNELITNILKYAYPEGHGGIINIETRKNENTVTVIVADNGIGLPEGFSIKRADTMGLSLVKMLVDQIGGNLNVESSSGTRVSITFKA